MTIIPAVIAWAFTLTFLVALILVLLDVAGVRRIGDENQRKWLFRSLFASVILAVTGFGTWQFEAFRRPVEPAAPQQAETEARADPQPAPKQQPETRREAREEPARANDPRPAVNAEVAAWALATLGKRPAVPAAFDRTYPGCAAELGARAFADIDPGDASECRTQLSEHHYRYIVSFYRAKEAYDRALRNQEIALRRGGIQEGETARYNFIVAENEDFNDPGGPTLGSIEEAEARIRRDTTLCRTHRCSRDG